MFPWAHQVHNPNGISIGSAVLHSSRQSVIGHVGAYPFPSKFPLSVGDLDPFYGSLGPLYQYIPIGSAVYTAQGTESLYGTLQWIVSSPKVLLSHRLSGPQLIGLHGSLGPPESTTQTAYRLVQPFLQGSRQHPYILQWAAPSPKIALTMEILTQYTTWFLEPTRAHSPNSIFNGPAAFCRRRYQKSCYYGHAMRRGSLPPVAGFWRCMSITPENFKRKSKCKILDFGAFSRRKRRYFILSA